MNLAAMALASCALEIICADATVPQLLPDQGLPDGQGH